MLNVYLQGLFIECLEASPSLEAMISERTKLVANIFKVGVYLPISQILAIYAAFINSRMFHLFMSRVCALYDRRRPGIGNLPKLVREARGD